MFPGRIGVLKGSAFSLQPEARDVRNRNVLPTPQFYPGHSFECRYLTGTRTDNEMTHHKAAFESRHKLFYA